MLLIYNEEALYKIDCSSDKVRQTRMGSAVTYHDCQQRITLTMSIGASLPVEKVPEISFSFEPCAIIMYQQ